MNHYMSHDDDGDDNDKNDQTTMMMDDDTSDGSCVVLNGSQVQHHFDISKTRKQITFKDSITRCTACANCNTEKTEYVSKLFKCGSGAGVFGEERIKVFGGDVCDRQVCASVEGRLGKRGFRFGGG
jgi:hypothetical protein